MTGRLTALLAVIGALGIAFSGLGAGASAVQALGWASAAGVGLSAMLKGPGLRVMGVLGVMLAAGALASAALAGGWAWLAAVFAGVLAVAAVATIRRGPAWRQGAAARKREPVRDLWKQFDAGDDPTTDANEPDGQDPR
ncbi:hypothetical protein [Tessaracoccus antarcticus]|uniref:Tryptophan-associated transmembrane protein n=1 Tax=Tessaracoccus antarcticus TaxID=2479848 RepID=A0A3M0G1E3_9ACTN|nr:hypothetical protein [Tessaracoccus antarcticus]RMB58790.1 hypothetical protein EAX62_11720 [Tessaracoccus antarcticus]